MSKYLKITNIYDYIYTPYMLSRPLSDTPYQIIDAYFNRPDVKTAMHVDQQMTFSLLSQKVSQNYVSFGSSLDFYQQFFYANLKILIYNGLNDADVPFKYTRDSILLLQQKTGMKLTQKQAQWVTPMPRQASALTFLSLPASSSSCLPRARAGSRFPPACLVLSKFLLLPRLIRK